MKKRLLALLLAGTMLLTACQPTYTENDPNYPGTTRRSQGRKEPQSGLTALQ